MAVDEAILESATRREVPPTLRLYGWNPPCLSLGQAQPVSDVNWKVITLSGWQVVRRPTGGRAILHVDELTYSVCGPEDEPRLAGGVLESYRVLAAALVYALHLLGVPAQIHEKQPAAPNPIGGGEGALSHFESGNGDEIGRKNPVCFEVPSDYEITVGGKKLIGSAQARRKGGVLQHGSLPLCGDLGRVVEALNFSDEESRRKARERLLQRAATVESVVGKTIEWEVAAQAFIQAFEQILHLRFKREELTPWEQARAQELETERYTQDEWTRRV